MSLFFWDCSVVVKNCLIYVDIPKWKCITKLVGFQMAWKILWILMWNLSLCQVQEVAESTSYECNQYEQIDEHSYSNVLVIIIQSVTDILIVVVDDSGTFFDRSVWCDVVMYFCTWVTLGWQWWSLVYEMHNNDDNNNKKTLLEMVCYLSVCQCVLISIKLWFSGIWYGWSLVWGDGTWQRWKWLRIGWMTSYPRCDSGVRMYNRSK